MFDSKVKFMKKHKLLFVIPLITGIFCWTLMTDATEKDPGTLEYLELFAQCYELIQSRYIEETDPVVLAEGAIEGMLLESSPYSALLPVEGQSGLIPPFGPLSAGIVPGFKDPMIRAIDVIPGSPAEQAGIRSGDTIIRVNGEVTPYLTTDRVERMLSGDSGDVIELLIQREITGKLEEIEIELHAYDEPVPEIRITYDDNIRIVQIIGRLTLSTPEDLYHALTKSNDVDMPTILDLRNVNRGDEILGVRLADVFITDETKILHTCSKDENELGYVIANDGWELTEFPLALIIDSTSAGPAETCAAALQSVERAVITGDKSFGRAVYRDILRLDDRYELMMVTACFCTVTGESIHKNGVIPDVPVVLPVPENIDPYVSTAKMQLVQAAANL
jgi:carboxyl-terminal processing protease